MDMSILFEEDKMEQKFIDASNLLMKKDFVEELKKQASDEEVQALFEKNGVKLELADIEQMVEESALANNGDELNADDLDNVSGGIVGTVTCFVLAGAQIAFYASYGYHRYKRR